MAILPRRETERLLGRGLAPRTRTMSIEDANSRHWFNFRDTFLARATERASDRTRTATSVRFFVARDLARVAARTRAQTRAQHLLARGDDKQRFTPADDDDLYAIKVKRSAQLCRAERSPLRLRFIGRGKPFVRNDNGN